MATKNFYWNESKAPVLYRPGTSDEAIIQAVLVERKEYLFPEMNPRICYDIGGNIGVLAVVMANVYPDAQIYSFEPVKENYELLKANCIHYPNIQHFNYGLGSETGLRRIWHSDDPTNFGGFSTSIKNSKNKSEMISLRDVADVFREYGVPDVVKIDVEGAEAEIFEAMPNLEGIKWITGELHGVREYQVLDLLSRDFSIQCNRNFADKVWHFQAVNRTWSNSLDGAQLA